MRMNISSSDKIRLTTFSLLLPHPVRHVPSLRILGVPRIARADILVVQKNLDGVAVLSRKHSLFRQALQKHASSDVKAEDHTPQQGRFGQSDC